MNQTYLDLISNFITRIDVDSFVFGMCVLTAFWLSARTFLPEFHTSSFMIGTSIMALFWVLVRIFAQQRYQL